MIKTEHRRADSASKVKFPNSENLANVFQNSGNEKRDVITVLEQIGVSFLIFSCISFDQRFSVGV